MKTFTSIFLFLISFQLVYSQEKYIIDGIFFDYGKSSLHSQSFNTMDKLAALLIDNKRINVEIGVHGRTSNDLNLTEGRAQSICNYLIKKGVNEKQITYKGYGNSVPLMSPTNCVGQVANGRTEIYFIENSKSLNISNYNFLFTKENYIKKCLIDRVEYIKYRCKSFDYDVIIKEDSLCINYLLTDALYSDTIKLLLLNKQEEFIALELSAYNSALKGNIKECDFYLTRFPNGKNTAKIIENKEKCFYTTSLEGSISDCDKYLNSYPNGKYIVQVNERKSQLIKIDEEQKIAKQKQLEEERLAKIKAQQDKVNAELQYEQSRKNSIINASIGDRLCFSQGWTRTESFFFMPYTAANYTMSIICFIERKEGENYQIRIADVSSSQSGEYSSPNINGVKVSKGDIIWVKPLGDANWHKCD